MNEPNERRTAGSADTSRSIHDMYKGRSDSSSHGDCRLTDVYVERGRTEVRIEEGTGATWKPT